MAVVSRPLADRYVGARGNSSGYLSPGRAAALNMRQAAYCAAAVLAIAFPGVVRVVGLAQVSAANNRGIYLQERIKQNRVELGELQAAWEGMQGPEHIARIAGELNMVLATESYPVGRKTLARLP